MSQTHDVPADDHTRLVDLTVGTLRAMIRAELAQASVAPPDPNRRYTLAEFCAIARCSDRHARRLIARGVLRAEKIAVGGSSRIRIRQAEIDRLLGGAG